MTHKASIAGCLHPLVSRCVFVLCIMEVSLGFAIAPVFVLHMLVRLHLWPFDLPLCFQWISEP